MLFSHRIVRRELADSAFEGEGARLYGGRWNSKGRPMVYTSSSLALATLEVLVHLESNDVLMREYCHIRASFPEALCETLDLAGLHPRWHEDPPPQWTRDQGDTWLREQTSAVLRVPSALIPDEMNFLINPAHPDFARIGLEPARTFAFPPRLLKRPPL